MDFNEETAFNRYADGLKSSGLKSSSSSSKIIIFSLSGQPEEDDLDGTAPPNSADSSTSKNITLQDRY